jgi:AcrR family transcriptional regulator
MISFTEGCSATVSRVNASRTARERVRAELTREITETARRHLSTDGAAGLSLRAVARDMGMVSSAIYRYFPSRDDLLTALIIDGYDAVGAAAEDAVAACPQGDQPRRWLVACRAVRAWALAHPHEYALVYGSPVPGYQAPEQTIGPASRVAAVLGEIIAGACRDAGRTNPGQLTTGPPTTASTPPGEPSNPGTPTGDGHQPTDAGTPPGQPTSPDKPPGQPPPGTPTSDGHQPTDAGYSPTAGHPPSPDPQSASAGDPSTTAGHPPSPDPQPAGIWEPFTEDADRLRSTVLPGVPDELAARAVTAWAGVFGLVSFEVFGQFENVITDREAFFDHAAANLGRLAGLP